MKGTSLQFWTDLLRLPDYEVAHVREESDLHCYRVTVVPVHRVGVCPHCGKASDKAHQTRLREGIHDLPISNHAVELKVRVVQWECQRCQKCFTPAVPFLAEGGHTTERFIRRAAELIRSSDVANAANFLGVPERTLADWYYAYLNRCSLGEPQQLGPIGSIGIDELSLKKNIGNTSP